jgi:molybdate transport system substrate-binding protein
MVFAAASLTDVLEDIGGDFTAATGIPVRFSFAGSPALARQIEAGARADLFLSADVEWMDYLEERGFLAAGTRRNLLGNELVLIAPAGSDVVLEARPGLPLAAALGRRRLAMGDPVLVPAGRYGRAALESLGAWSDVGNRLAPAENVRVALAWVARGEAPLGIVYRSDALAEPRVRVVTAFPAGSHPPIVYPVARLGRSPAPARAAAFQDWLGGPRARDRFLAAGFTVH